MTEQIFRLLDNIIGFIREERKLHYKKLVYKLRLEYENETTKPEEHINHARLDSINNSLMLLISVFNTEIEGKNTPSK